MDTPLGISVSTGKAYSAMIAEDSFADRELLKRFLQASQFNILADVTNGQMVLDYIQHYDVIPDILFLDYKMQPKNAVETIQEIRALHPNMLIVVVTGNTDRDVINQLVKLKINSYILKPINKSSLDEKLIGLLGRKDLVVESKLAPKKKAIKAEELSIPPLSAVAHKVLLFEGNPVTGSSELEQIILPDKSICADLLRMANSAYYARSTKIQTIKDAITLLGLKTIKNIVMLQSKKYITRNLVYSDIFKKHLLELPILTALVAFDLSVPLGLKSIKEDLFLLAMMRKIGMTILALNSPQLYTEILNQVDQAPSDLSSFEKEEFGLNHIEVGTHIFNVWQMPKIFVNMMKNQNFTMEEFSYTDNYDKILRLAGIIGRQLLSIPLLASEIEISHIILKHYKAPENMMELFGEDYYEGIKSHPFFESI